MAAVSVDASMADAAGKSETGKWLVGLTVFALFMTFLGIAVVYVLSGGV
jgi:hypothetical protein